MRGRRAAGVRVAIVLFATLVASCHDQPVEPDIAPALAVTPDVLLEGDSYRLTGESTTHLLYGGSSWQYPDEATVRACTGGYPAVVREAAGPPAGSLAGMLPSVTQHAWLTGLRPVKADDGPAVFVVIGCVKSLIPDATTFTSMFGAAGWGQVVIVPAAVLDSVPTGPHASAPLRPAGTLIKSAGSPEVRWILQTANARTIPSLGVLQSYCRTDVVETDDAEFETYPAAGLLDAAHLDCGTAAPVPVSGQPFRVDYDPDVAYLAFGGEAWRYPDQATLDACTGNHTGVVRTLDHFPALVGGRVLPSALDHRWLDGSHPVKASDHPAVYVLNGCVKAAIPDLATLTHIFGVTDFSTVVEVAPAVLDSVPTGPSAFIPFFPFGTLIRGSSAEVRWITYAGGSLTVPDLETLASYCRSDVVAIDDDVFTQYRAATTLRSSSRSCDTDAPAVPTIASGWYHRCAIDRAGGVWCWGLNSAGQLGDGTRINRLTPVPAEVPERATTVAAGSDHTCAIGVSGAAYCWGGNVLGQLGSGPQDSMVTRPVAVAGSLRFRSITAGRHHTCAITRTDAVYCWGDNIYGQSAQGTLSGRGFEHTPDVVWTPALVRGLRARAVAASGSAPGSVFGRRTFTCALALSGQPYCWGFNGGDSGQLTASAIPEQAPTEHTFQQISAHEQTACGLDAGGVVHCWQHAIESDGTSVVPELRFTAISARCGIAQNRIGYCWPRAGAAAVMIPDEPLDQIVHGCGITPDGRALCGVGIFDSSYGDRYGESGDGYAFFSPFPAGPSGPHFDRISAGLTHWCGLAAGGQAYCWGTNSFGELGTGDDADRHEPTPVATDERFIRIGAGASYTCALTADGRLYCWGSRTRIALVSLRDIRIPTPADTDHRFTHLAVGGRHACGITSDGFAHCWGGNRDGALGVNLPGGSTHTPTRVSGGLRFVDISPSKHSLLPEPQYTCGVTEDGALYCWGATTYGRVPHPGGYEPRLMSDEVRFRSVSAGGTHACALSVDDHVYCWGRSDQGALGYLASEDCGYGLHACSTRPRPLPGGIRGKHIASGVHANTCVLSTDDRVHCWGAGAAGGLGDGTTFNRLDPLPVIGLGGVAALDNGQSTACAALAAGVSCWGSDVVGMRGDGPPPPGHPGVVQVQTTARFTGGDAALLTRSLARRSRR